MISRKDKWQLAISIILLCVTVSLSTFLFIKSYFPYFLITISLTIFQAILFYRRQIKAYTEIENFTTSIRYRDFTRHYDETRAPENLKKLRSAFNQVNTSFKLMSGEKERQHQYLEKILEMIDTGILSYQEDSGEVIWMNESLKKMLALPYLKNIESLAKRRESLYPLLISLNPAESKITTLSSGKNELKVLLSVTKFKSEGKFFKLIAFQNVSKALDETETNAWQKLLSVLTHEIMNSVAPISSLANTLKMGLQAKTLELDDLEMGIETIERRSEGLLKFAEVYRSLNKIIKPNLKRIDIQELFNSLVQLMQPTFTQHRIEIEIVIKQPNLTFEVDKTLIEQVLINLIINAIDAIKETVSPKITLSASSENHQTLIQIMDNGPGISAEILEKIFIPFFSTKKNGSGIGLTLSKQIVLLHNASIHVQSEKNEGTAFILVFN